MYHFHQDKETYFRIQYLNSKNSILPFNKDYVPLNASTRVMEIGSAEGGNLKPFAEAGCQCTGIEPSSSRIKLAKKFLDKEVQKGQISFINKNIYDVSPIDLEEVYDFIFLKDVLEHVHNQEEMLTRLKEFLKPDGKIFFGFPSWYMPFGGHQQMCYNKFLARLPYFHLLPMGIYRKILNWFNKHEKQNEGLIEIKETGISIQKFEKILKTENYRIIKKQFYFIPPIYYYKFSLKTRKLYSFIGNIPYFRELFITSAYYLIERM